MKLRDPRLWIGAVSAAAVVWFVVQAVGLRAAPGPLAAVHARVPELAGRFGCSQCHGGFTRGMTASCLECHAEIEAQLAAGTGLHGTVESGKCAQCHSEHHGEPFAMVNRLSFARAGVSDPGAFDHDLVGFAMAGAHLDLACSDCHEHADAAVLPEGAHRFLGLEQGCASCHDDPHEGRMAFACADCHHQESFAEPIYTAHDELLLLAGAHAGLDCRACHDAGDPRALEKLGRGGALAPRQCTDCHESPHRAEFVTAVAGLVSMPAGASCVSCHRPDHTTFRDPRLDVTAAQHACSGFTLDAPHDGLACADCHDPEPLATFADRFPGRGAGDCRRCHADPHGGQFDTGPFAGEQCSACHERTRFVPHAFTADLHARAAMPLDGRHAELRCEACHELSDGGGPRLFHGTPSRCELCHEDPHRGFFDPHAEALAGTPRGTCARCHGTESFSEIEPGAFDHGAWTGFALAGAHAQAACESCHRRLPEPDPLGRTFGVASVVFGPVGGCVSCHADPHDGAFDDPRRPSEVAGRRGCARCHVETSFRVVRDEFDHGRFTGFALDGRHAMIGCAACHPTSARPDEIGRTRGHAAGTRCADCHEDPHAGQFRHRGRVDCRRCHRSSASFAELTFNHNLTRFPLDDAHREVACSACHRPALIGEKEVVRYRPLGTDCADCHGDQKRPIRRRRTR